MYPSVLIANFFVQKGLDEQKLITPMQAIKLTYISHGWHLGIKEAPLIDENPEAWQFGPVVVSAYDKFKPYGRNPINALAQGDSLSGESFIDFGRIDNETKLLLEAVWNGYKKFSGLQLSSMTHEKGTPWYITWHDQEGKHRRNAQISELLIKEHYKKLLDERTRKSK